ncbi:MAG TPA: molybdopterin converting factor subunit 1 [Gammaproteobacteria bacterium]|nr:molybdopterin converting factor subunit 1 [Gammaproteobacteria bacterium]
MAITVKFFASLRERMGREEVVLEPRGIGTVAEVWLQVAGDEAVPANLLMAVNMEYAEPHSAVQDGDEVAFFPPVTGGSDGC